MGLKTEQDDDDELIAQILHSSDYDVQDKIAYRNGKKRLQIITINTVLWVEQTTTMMTV